VAALGVIDRCLGQIVDAIEAVDAGDPEAPGALLAITADHGNADELRDGEGHPVTAHSLNPVPLVLVGRAAHGKRLGDGVLADVAPTLLDFAGLPRWEGMTGRSRIL
jgi:2,3-bisphosphoglycerate-independent phosphoglycerate mutase